MPFSSLWELCLSNSDKLPSSDVIQFVVPINVVTIVLFEALIYTLHTLPILEMLLVHRLNFRQWKY